MIRLYTTLYGIITGFLSTYCLRASVDEQPFQSVNEPLPEPNLYHRRGRSLSCIPSSKHSKPPKRKLNLFGRRKGLSEEDFVSKNSHTYSQSVLGNPLHDNINTWHECHLSCVTFHVALFMWHLSLISYHLSIATWHLSLTTCHVSLIMCHSPLITCHVSYVTCHVSHMLNNTCHMSHLYYFAVWRLN